MGRERKKNLDCVKEDILRRGGNAETTFDRIEWKRKICCADSTKWDKGRARRIIFIVLGRKWL